MTSSSNSSDSTTALETALKEHLDKVLIYLEKFITTKQDLTAIESKLKDYDNLLELVQITDNVFASLTEKIDQKLLAQTGGSANYDELEKILQKHEDEIRNHIRIEQQLKLYSESLQDKLDDSEKTRGGLLDQTKIMLNDVRRDNQKLTESLKQKNEEIEKLNKTLKALEEANRNYEAKLQGIPHLQDRLNHLEKKRKLSNSKPIFILKDTSHSVIEGENSKRVDPDVDQSRPNSKSETARKTLKATNTAQYSSPMKLIHKTLSNVSTTINKTQEYVRVKVEGGDAKSRKDFDALKQSYQKFYNPNKGVSKDRLKERDRHATSVNRTRDMKSIYSIALITNSSNTSLIQNNQNQHNSSQRDLMGSRIHQRSSSHDMRPKTKTSFMRAKEGF